MILVISALFSYCCPGAPIGFSFSYPYLDGFCSVFYRPHFLSDIVFPVFTVYPALMAMDRIVRRLNQKSMISTGNVTLDFTIAVIMLVFGIGGGSNLLASRMTDNQVYGFKSVVAASLTYSQRITGGRNVLVTMWNQPVTAVTAYWSGLALLVIQNNNRSRHWVPAVAAWLIAGLAGSILAKTHLENVQFFGDFLKLFGMA